MQIKMDWFRQRNVRIIPSRGSGGKSVLVRFAKIASEWRCLLGAQLCSWKRVAWIPNSEVLQKMLILDSRYILGMIYISHIRPDRQIFHNCLWYSLKYHTIIDAGLKLDLVPSTSLIFFSFPLKRFFPHWDTEFLILHIHMQEGSHCSSRDY